MEAPIITGKLGGFGRRLITIILIVAVSTFTGVAATQAEPAAITQAKSEAQALQERIDELNDQLEAAVEEYNYAKAKLSETAAAIEDTQAKLAEAGKDLETARAQLERRIVEIYKQGHLGMVDALVGASSLSDLINRIDLMKRLSEQDSRVIQEVEAYQDQVSEHEAKLAQELEEEKTLAADAKAAKNKVQERLAANKVALAGKETQIAQLEKEEAARQAKLAAEAKKAAEEAARQAKLAAAEKAKNASKSGTSKSSGGSGGSSGTGTAVSSSATGEEVVSIAMKYLGCPYVWAGADPSGFDCSGFVMYVYRKIGVNLPHSSRLQYNYGASVARSDLRPGDLVFFYNPIHHVGIYIGDGKMIDAAGTGKDVRISNVWTNNYTGARRIIK